MDLFPHTQISNNPRVDFRPAALRSAPGGLMADGRFSIDPREGMMLFSAAKRGGSGLGSADWRAGDVSVGMTGLEDFEAKDGELVKLVYSKDWDSR